MTGFRFDIKEAMIRTITWVLLLTTGFILLVSAWHGIMPESLQWLNIAGKDRISDVSVGIFLGGISFFLWKRAMGSE